MNRMLIQIRGVYDGTCVIYYPKEKRFDWQEPAKTKTTETFRKDFEQQFLKDLNA